MSSRRPPPVGTTVAVPTPYKDVLRVTTREAQATVAHMRALYDPAESLGACLEVVAILWRTLPFAGAIASLIFISVEERIENNIFPS